MISPTLCSALMRRALDRSSSGVSAALSSIQMGAEREDARGPRQQRVVGVLQHALPQAVRVHPRLARQQPLHQLRLGHFEAEDRDRNAFLDRRVLRDVEAQGRLAHGGPRRDDHQVRILEPRRLVVQVCEARRHAGNRLAAGMERFDALHRRPQQLLEADEALGLARLRDQEDPLLGAVEDLVGEALGLVGLLHDARGGLDQPAEQRLVADDLRVVVDVRRGGHDVEQVGEVLDAAHALELAPPVHLVTQGDRVDHPPALDDAVHGAEQPPVALAVEHRVVEELGAAERRVAVEEHRAEDRLLGLGAVGRLAAAERVRRRRHRRFGARCGCHPRSDASSSGYGAGLPGDR